MVFIVIHRDVFDSRTDIEGIFKDYTSAINFIENEFGLDGFVVDLTEPIRTWVKNSEYVYIESHEVI